MDAKATAAVYLENMNLPPSLYGAEIRLADYETEADLKFMKSAQEWPLEFHRAVNREIAREMRARGATVTLVTISMPEYLHWLAASDLKNDAANRARFIAQKTNQQN